MNSAERDQNTTQHSQFVQEFFQLHFFCSKRGKLHIFIPTLKVQQEIFFDKES